MQSIRSFRECSVPLTVIQYLLLFLLQKGAGCALLVLAFAFLTLLFRSGKLAYLAAALTGGAEFLCCRLLHPASLFNSLKFLNIFYILNPARIYTEYVNLNLFGQPVGIRGGLAVFCAAGAALLIGGVCFFDAPSAGMEMAGAFRPAQAPSGTRQHLPALSGILSGRLYGQGDLCLARGGGADFRLVPGTAGDVDELSASGV